MRREIAKDFFTALLSRTIQLILDADKRFQPFAGRIRRLQIRYIEEQFQLAVLGQFKRGKSTLLNALLGAPILPSALVPVTSVPVFLRSANEPHVRVTFLDGRSEAVSLESLPLFVTEEKNPDNQKGVKEVTVSCPAQVMDAGITLIDTPGIGSTFAHNTQTTLEFLPQCDAALFLVSADPPITEVELQFLKEVRKHVAKIYFILNKVDYLSKDELHQATTFLERVLLDHLKEAPRIFCVSARRALESRIEGDSELWKDSGMEALESELIRFAREDKIQVLQAALSLKGEAILTELIFQIDMEVRSLELPLDDLNKRLEFFNEKLSKIDEDKQIAEDVLQGEHRRLISFIETTCQELREEISEKMRPWAGNFFGKSKEQGNLSGIEARFRAEMLDLLLGLLNQRLLDFMEELKARIQKAMLSQAETAQSLFDALNRAAADIFEISFESFEKVSRVALPEKFSWNTIVWSGSIVTPSAQTIEKLVPETSRMRMMEKRLTGEMLDLVTQNIEKMRWGALQKWDEMFRKFRADVEERYQSLSQGIHGSVTAARERRTTMKDTVKPTYDLLTKLRADMDDARDRLKNGSLETMPEEG